MGILNVTPDSFSDGGRWQAVDAAIARGVALFEEGADWVDVGGESTRPGAEPVPAEVECERVIPVIAGLAQRCPGRVISVDTAKATVAERALDSGATLVNDVTALADPDMAGVIARAGAGVVLMHLRGAPATMQRDTVYEDLISEVVAYLAERLAIAQQAGIQRIHLDPGIGFGKAQPDNVLLIAAVPRFRALGPVVIGASRKAFIGRLIDVTDPSQRVHGSIGAAIAAAALGADVLRVHDVRATREALVVWTAVNAAVMGAAMNRDAAGPGEA